MDRYLSPFGTNAHGSVDPEPLASGDESAPKPQHSSKSSTQDGVAGDYTEAGPFPSSVTYVHMSV